LDPLIEGLCHPWAYSHPVRDLRVVETHISWVLLTGDFAYKIKKPLDLGFLDFSTLEKRRFFCEEEVRLNRRLAPALYLDAVPITNADGAPRMGGAGPAVEYAVRMRQFPDEARLDHVLARGELGPEHVDQLAAHIAAFHAALPPAGPEVPFGTPENVAQYARQNFCQIRTRLAQSRDLSRLLELETWTERELIERASQITTRRRQGSVRECHGDLHLANMALLAGRVEVFDCIEFNPELRWIDVMSEAAFTVMDLEDRDRRDLANRFLNGYLEAGGDYGGLDVLRFYLVYRALVRAKVSAIRMAQAELPDADRAKALAQCRDYLALGGAFTRSGQPALLITHGPSGAGKTTLTTPLVENLGALRLRSDVERKRLFGLAPGARTASGIGEGIYGLEADGRTYGRLAELAGTVIQAGYPVIVDATFLKRKRREAFRQLAQRCNTPFAILDFRAPGDTLRERVSLRQAAGRDPSEAGIEVLQRQQATAEPLDRDELGETIPIDSTRPQTLEKVLEHLRALMRLGGR